MTDNPIYREKLSSNKTEALFVALTLLFLALTLWRVDSRGWDGLAITFAVFCAIFIFYSLNYRTLVIRLTSESLKLTFGIFTWTVPLDNIEDCQLDELPAIMKYGGAGIHFMTVRNRYRASFNFLEYPRIVVAFKRKVGLARDISFSTRRPEEVMRLIRELKRILMENSARLQSMLDAAEKRIKETGGVSHEDVWKMVEAEVKKTEVKSTVFND